MPLAGSSEAKTRLSAKTSWLEGTPSFSPTAARDQVARPLGRLDRGVAHHERHAARVAAEIDGREARVAGDDADVERLEPEDLGDARRQDVVAALADLGSAAERRDLARAVEPELDSSVWHVVPVNGQARRPRGSSSTRGPSPRPIARHGVGRDLAATGSPAARVDDFLDALS